MGYALACAVPAGTIRVAQGVYSEHLLIMRTVALLGGYEAARWTRDAARYVTTLDGAYSSTVPGGYDKWWAASGTVLSDSGKLGLWYLGTLQHHKYDTMAYAESADWLAWTKWISNPVMSPGPQDADKGG